MDSCADTVCLLYGIGELVVVAQWSWCKRRLYHTDRLSVVRYKRRSSAMSYV